MKKTKYVNPKLIKEEVQKFKLMSEYNYFTDLSEEEDQDQLTMDDFNQSPEQPSGDAGAPPPAGNSPMGAEPKAPDAGQQGPPEDPFGMDNQPQGGEEPPAEAPDMSGAEPTQEIDVTDIVQSTKNVDTKSDEINAKVDQTLEKVQSLFANIQKLESNLQKMDQAMTKIDAIYKEVQLAKPPTPEEVKEAMAQNSYPFNVTLDKYNQMGTPKNQTELENKKNKLSLSNILSDFNERDIRQSFEPTDPFKDRLSNSMPSYRV